MRLARIFVQNYRSIRELDLTFGPGKTVIVGRNNSGKSNILKAIDLVLGENSPTYSKSDNVTEEDFYSWREVVGDEVVTRRAAQIVIWAELERAQDEALNFPEINRCFGYKRREERLTDAEIRDNPASVFDHSDQNYAPWIDSKLTNQTRFEKELGNKFHFFFVFEARLNEHGDVSKDIRLLYRESPSQGWLLAFKATVRSELLQSAVIESFRDPHNQLRLTSWSWYGKLIKELTSRYAGTHDLENALEQVRNVADTIFSQLQNDLATSSLKVAFPGASISLQFNTESRNDLYKSCVLYVDDGIKSPLAEKGSGIQSATIIGLFTYYVLNINTKTAALLCVEEPEIYLHPHARRVISRRLDEFLQRDRNQVIMTTHSAEFIGSTNPNLHVVRVEKNESGTIARPVDVGKYRQFFISPGQAELFFAEAVIICEGDDEYLIRIVAERIYGDRLDELNISVVRAGGKDGIAKLTRLSLQLGIKCFVLTDFDFLLRDKTVDAETYGAKKHDSVMGLPQQWFAQECTFGAKGNESRAFLERLRAKIKAKNPREFYTAKRSDEFGEFATRFAEVLPKLRQKGLGVLPGELEDVVLKKDLLIDGKFTFESARRLHAALNDGEDLGDFVETDEIAELLDHVFERCSS